MWSVVHQHLTSLHLRSYNFNLTKGGRQFPWIHTSFTWGVRELRWDVSFVRCC